MKIFTSCKAPLIYRFFTLQNQHHYIHTKTSLLRNITKSHIITRNMNIFTDAGNVHTLRLLASCYATNTEVAVKLIHKKSDGFQVPGLINHPLPVLQVHPQGSYIFSHNAATSYVFNRTKELTCDVEATKVDEILEWDSTRLQPSVFSVLASHVLAKKDVPVDLLSGVLGKLNELLARSGEFLVGGRLSAADVVVWGSVYGVMQLDDVAKLVADKHPCVHKWFTKLSSMDAFMKAIENVVGSEGVAAFKPFFERYGTTTPLSHASVAGEKGAPSTEEVEEIVTTQQINEAKAGWEKGLSGEKPKARQHPILPKEGK